MNGRSKSKYTVFKPSIQLCPDIWFYLWFGKILKITRKDTRLVKAPSFKNV